MPANLEHIAAIFIEISHKAHVAERARLATQAFWKAGIGDLPKFLDRRRVFPYILNRLLVGIPKRISLKTGTGIECSICSHTHAIHANSANRLVRPLFGRFWRDLGI